MGRGEHSNVTNATFDECLFNSLDFFLLDFDSCRFSIIIRQLLLAALFKFSLNVSLVVGTSPVTKVPA